MKLQSLNGHVTCTRGGFQRAFESSCCGYWTLGRPAKLRVLDSLKLFVGTS